MDDTLFAGKQILVVDDSTTIRVFLKGLLVERGAELSEAGTGEEALALCRTHPRFDLIVLDLLLPDTNGLHVLSRIRGTNEESAIVMLTGVGGIKSAMAAIQEGADGYIEKHDLTADGDCTEFFYALEQGIQHRSGIVAQKQLQQVKADFYSVITHDLRNPAGAVTFALELLQDERLGPLNTEQRELLELATTSAGKLTGLINDYLDFAKIDAGFLTLEPCEADLNAIVAAAVKASALQARARGHTVRVDTPAEPVHAVVDAERLTQVLDNLLSNAIKYTPEGGQIAVQLRVEDGQAVLRVSDNGRGIAPQQIPALFSKYHRLPGEAVRGVTGTGLGLLIVKEVIAAHGGSVSAESTGIPGLGTTFTVRIPLCPGR